MKTYRIRTLGKGGEVLRETFTRNYEEASKEAAREIEWKLRMGQTLTIDLLRQ